MGTQSTWGQHTSNMSDEKSWLILEYGSGTINAGLSGTSDDPADAPTSMFRTCIGRPNYELSIGADDKAQYLFDAALVARDEDGTIVQGGLAGICKLSWPMSRGVIKDYGTHQADMQEIWKDYIDETAKVVVPFDRENPEDCDIDGIILSEPCLNSLANRKTVAEYWMEEQKAPKIFFGLQSIFGMMGDACISGVAVTSGDGVTEVLPMYENYSLRHAYQRINWAGKDVTNWLRRELHKADCALETSSDELILMDMKKASGCLRIANHGELEEEKAKLEEKKFESFLPDGTSVHIGAECVTVPEIVFNPMSAGNDVPGLAELVKQCVDACPKDTKGSIFKKIECFGGNTMFPGFKERLDAELSVTLKHDGLAKVRCQLDREIKPWMGAKILSENSTFQNPENKMWLGQAEWNELGSARVSAMSQC